jgi:tetratricopeptide (TPR) repeat protein
MWKYTSFKIISATVIVISITLLSAKSFYTNGINNFSNRPPNVYRGPSGHVAICGSPYTNSDSLFEIPALKGWGHHSFKISNASDSAQFYFNQGLSLYFSFHAIEAVASFTKAARLSPDCAMAWYGRALAMGPTINYENGYIPPSEAYNAAIKSKDLFKGDSKLEADLIQAIQSRYSPDTTANVTTLRIRYAAAMEKVYRKYPHNADVITLYADALLLLHPWDLYDHDLKPKSWTPAIRSLLELAMKINPKHPGANHYYIHTMEGSSTPELALKSAHLLDTLMPGVSHITHMPSHIYIRTGDYNRGISANNKAVKAYYAALKQFAPVKKAAGLYKLHNIHLKVNCAQMAGNFKVAEQGSAELQEAVKTKLNFPGALGNYLQYIYMQPAFTAIRFGKWRPILNIKPVDSLSYAGILAHFARGMAYCALDSTAKAKRELVLMEDAIKKEKKSLALSLDNFSPSAEPADVARLLLAGTIAKKEKNFQSAMMIYQKAVMAEDHIIYNEPRDWPLPTRQYLADIYIDLGRYQEAEKVLLKDLDINPENGWALTGLRNLRRKGYTTYSMANINKRLRKAWIVKDQDIHNVVFR